MSRHLKILILFAIGLCIAYGSYWFGANRAATAIGTFYIDTSIQNEIKAIRYEERMLRGLALGQYDSAFNVAKFAYFFHVLQIAEIAEQTQDPVIKQDVNSQIAKANALKIELSYQFPTEEENKLWAQLVK